MRLGLIVCLLGLGQAAFAGSPVIAVFDKNGFSKFIQSSQLETSQLYTSQSSIQSLEVGPATDRKPLPARIRDLFNISQSYQMFGVHPSVLKFGNCDIPADVINSDSTHFSCAFPNENGQLIQSTCRWRAKRIEIDFPGGHGGHVHDDNGLSTDRPRPQGDFTRQGTSTPTSDFMFEYKATEVAGLEMFEVTGSNQITNEEGQLEWVDFAPFRIGVYTSSMGPFSLQSEDGYGPVYEEGYEGIQFYPVPDGEGYKFSINSHENEGRSLMGAAAVRLPSISAIYRDMVKEEVYPEIEESKIKLLQYTGASMLDGGVFDCLQKVDIGSAWTPPHCTHRRGVEVDLDVQAHNIGIIGQTLTPGEISKLRETLAAAILEAEFRFSVTNESPTSFHRHWHLQIEWRYQ